jgi:hypothetical protein
VSLSILCGGAVTTNAQSTALCLKPFTVALTSFNVGDQISLKTDAPNPGSPGWLGALDLGGGGADNYRDNIVNCNTSAVSIGDILPQETGNMAGPTKQGIESLIGGDPNAYWDTANQCVVTSERSSPRIILIPVYDPAYFSTNHEVKVAGFLTVFVEAILGGKQVVARVTTSNRTCTVTEPRETNCNDGFDNDGDGAIDCADDDCGCVP